MNLNHVNFHVENVNESKVFFKTFFNFKCVDLKGDNLPAVLKGKNDFTLVLMSLSFNRNESIAFPSSFHVGFLVDTKEEVILQYNKLKDGNISLENKSKNMRG